MFTATVSMAIEDFALSHALQEVPEMEVQADRLAAHSRHWVMPCIWVAGGDFEAFDAALSEDSTVQEVVSEVEYETEKFYQIHWTEAVKHRLDVALDAQASLLHAEAADGTWQLVIRFGTRNQFDTFRDHLTDEGVTFTLDDLTRSAAPQQFRGGVTAAQREALVTAVVKGYFAIPRETTMEEIADTLGISTQSASERIRRGIEEFVETMLVVDEGKITT